MKKTSGAASSTTTTTTSPYTFFTMESDDDFDFDDKSLNDYDECVERHPSLNFCAADFEDHKSTISQSSSMLSLPVCRICQLPSMEPNNHLVSKPHKNRTKPKINFCWALGRPNVRQQGHLPSPLDNKIRNFGLLQGFGCLIACYVSLGDTGLPI